jgi:hypothetical protein
MRDDDMSGKGPTLLPVPHLVLHRHVLGAARQRLLDSG